jgi:hypothetical protein
MFKKRIAALVMGLALIVAVAGASVGVAETLVSLDRATGQAIASASSGGGG